MFKRRTLLAGSALYPVTRALSAHAAPAAPLALPDAVKSFSAPFPSFGSIERLDPALDALIPPDAKLEKVAEGFDWIEGPLWVKKGECLLFSEIPLNSIYKYEEGKGVSVFMRPAGYFGTRTDLKEPGTNGLGLDKRGDLLMCQHGERRIAKLASWKQPLGKQIALADKFEGKRFNSPNDMVVHASGDIFFTDPPYGLGIKSSDDDAAKAAAKKAEEKDRELTFQGVFRIDAKGKVHLVTDQLERPNGIGLSPDQKTLYIANSHNPRPIIMAFNLKPDLSVDSGRIFFNGAELLEKKPNLKGAFDGLSVDKEGNLFATGPGGLLVISPKGKHLGTIVTGQATANCEFGGKDGKTLFITADMTLARVVTSTRGLA